MNKRIFLPLAATTAIMVFVAACVLIPRAVSYLDEIHPRGITRELAQWEQEYRVRDPDRSSVKHAREYLEYVENYYRYEDMPEYRDNDAVKELAKQRQETMKVIQDWIDANTPARAAHY